MRQLRERFARRGMGNAFEPLRRRDEDERQGRKTSHHPVDIPHFADTQRHVIRSEEHTSELQSLMRISYAVFCLKKKKKHTKTYTNIINQSLLTSDTTSTKRQ